MSATDETSSTESSEHSYDRLVGKSESKIYFFEFIHSYAWLFICSLAYFVIYFIETYKYGFDIKFGTTVVKLIMHFASAIVILEAIAGILRLFTHSFIRRVLFRKPDMWIIVDLLSLYTVFAYYLGFHLKARYLFLIYIALLTARNYKCFYYHWVVSQHGIVISFKTFISKYLVMYVFIAHTFACLWILLCPKCKAKYVPKDLTLEHLGATKLLFIERYKSGTRTQPHFSAFEEYSLCLYTTIGTMSTIGYGGPARGSDHEQLLVIASILITFLLHTMIISDLAILTIQKDLCKSIFSNRLQLIAQYILRERITENIKTKLINYYQNYWVYESSLNINDYIDILPTSLQTALHCDRYWFAINQAALFVNENLAFKRTISELMRTEYYNAGDFIVHQHSVRNKMIYIARGSLSILSEEDGQSPVLSLGVGACFGDSCLLYSYPVKCAIIAQSHCTLYVLHKRVLWSMDNMQNRVSGKSLFMKLLDRVKKAQAKIDSNTQETKPLRRMQISLINEEEININDIRNCYYIAPFHQPHEAYIINTVRTLEKHDEIFFQTSWPWKFWNTSSFMWIWDSFVVSVVVLLLFVWPYRIFFTYDYNSSLMKIWRLLFGFVFMLDVIIQLFTIAETRDGLVYTMGDIFKYRFVQFTFICDVIAAFPTEIIEYELNAMITDHETFVMILLSFKLFKIMRMITFVRNLEYRSMFIKQSNLRLLRHLLVVICSCYMCACLYHAVVCPQDVCVPDSWIESLKGKIIKDIGEQGAMTIFRSIEFLMTIYQSTMMVTMHSRIYMRSMEELFIYTYAPIFVILRHCYFVADYSATMVLSKRVRKHYNKFLCDIGFFMWKHSVHRKLRIRTWHYFEAQWWHNCNAYNFNLIYDAPYHLQTEQKVAYYHHLCKQAELFHLLPNSIVQMIASRCKTVFLPPGEIITYGGVHVDFMYIVDAGYCEVITNTTKRVKRHLGPGSNILVIEMLLNQTFLNEIRAKTHVRLVKIEKADIFYAFSSQPNIKYQLLELINEYVPRVEKLLVYSMRLHEKTTELHNPQEHTASWFVFRSYYSSSRLNNEYNEKFNVNNMESMLKYVMMRRTIIPGGNFIFYWEIFRSLVVWYMCMYIPAAFAYHAYNYYLKFIGFTGYFILLIDMYLQLHVCYYNENGILVSHPSSTAKNYLKTRFFVDFIGFFPFHLFILYSPAVGKLNFKNILECTFGKFLLLIRTRGLLYERRLRFKPHIRFTMIYLIFIIFAIYNLCTTYLLIITADFPVIKGALRVVPKKNSWLYDFRDKFYGKMVFNVYNYYLVYFRFVAMYILNIGYDRSKFIIDRYEKVFSFVNCIIGYFIFVLIIVYVANDFQINPQLTTFKSKLEELHTFLIQYKASKETIHSVLNHFDHLWYRTFSVTQEITYHLPEALRQDYAYMLYGKTLSKVLPFMGCDVPFKRMLGMHLTELYFQEKTIIYRINDIVDLTFILHSGEVTTYSADGRKLGTLCKGSIFGNFDDICMIRSMITVKANSDVILLAIKTSELYRIIAYNILIVHKLQTCITTDNLHYISSYEKPKGKIHRSVPTSFLKANKYRKNNRDYFYMILALISYIAVTYFITFGHPFALRLFINILDLMFVTKWIIDIVSISRTKKQLEKKWFSANIIIGFISFLPLEYFYSALTKPNEHYFRFLHLNRVLRLYFFYKFFNDPKLEYVQNILTMKLSYYLCYGIVYAQTVCCIFYLTACYDHVCLHNSWAYSEKAFCHTPYVCSMFYTLSMMFTNGHGTAAPLSRIDTQLALVHATLSKFFISTVSGIGLGVALHIKFKLMKFDERTRRLLESIERSSISRSLYQRINKHLSQLWLKTRGTQYANILQQLPFTLMCDVKTEIFGHHLYNNIIFEQCHVDFLRQLCCFLELQNYFDGDVIIEDGDINGTMYFIHSGFVEVFITKGECVQIVDVLEKNDSFGIVQGLYSTCKYQNTFKSRGNAEIVSLKLSKWRHLLKFFPATNYTIYESLQKTALSSR